jgi:hypothetical protein
MTFGTFAVLWPIVAVAIIVGVVAIINRPKGRLHPGE